MPFQTGHVPWNKGVPWSDLIKKKMRLAKLGKSQSVEHIHKRVKANTGKKRSEETKRKISLANKGQVPWNKGKTGVYSEAVLMSKAEKMKGNEYAKNHVVSEDVRRRIAEKLKGHFVSQVTKGRIREKRLFQVMPVKDTKIEVAIQGELDRRRIVYKKHVALLGRYQVDVLIDPLTVVECNGDYWHSEEIFDGKTWARDREKERLLAEAGYSVHSFWGSEIRADVVGCVDQVLGVV